MPYEDISLLQLIKSDNKVDIRLDMLMFCVERKLVTDRWMDRQIDRQTNGQTD